LRKENRKISKLVKLCNKVIYVDNPSLNSKCFDKEELIINKKRREDSREVMLERLKEVMLLEQDVYKPDSLKLVSEIF
jgi:hypothetical protein